MSATGADRGGAVVAQQMLHCKSIAIEIGAAQTRM